MNNYWTYFIWNFSYNSWGGSGDICKAVPGEVLCEISGGISTCMSEGISKWSYVEIT